MGTPTRHVSLLVVLLLAALGLSACTSSAPAPSPPPPPESVQWDEQVRVAQQVIGEQPGDLQLIHISSSAYMRPAIDAGNLTVRFSYQDRVRRSEASLTHPMYRILDVSFMDHDPQGTVEVTHDTDVGILRDEVLTDHLAAVRVTPRTALDTTRPDALARGWLADAEDNYSFYLSLVPPQDQQPLRWSITYEAPGLMLTYEVDAQTGAIVQQPK